MLFTSSGLGGDWEHHLWYVWHQGLALRADGAPSLFLSTPYSVFYPEYAFYGGTINALAGSLALIPGSTPTAAYVATYVLGFAAAYGGWYWAARMAGLGRLAAQAPALAYVTSACYLTLIYGEGDWPAFLGASAMPLMAAAGVDVLLAERMRVRSAIALAAATIVFFGSHNITMLWGSTELAAAAVLVLVCVPQARRRVKLRGIARLAGVFVPAALVNAWFLLPALAYSSHTKIVSEIDYLTSHYTLGGMPFNQLFTFSRAATLPDSPGYVLALPTSIIVWALASVVILVAIVRHGVWMRVLGVFCAVTGAVLIVMTHAAILSALPSPYDVLQFAYRLDIFVLMGVSAVVLAVLVALRSGPRRLRLYGWTIVPVLIVSTIGAVQQVGAYQRTTTPRAATFSRGSEVFAEIYNDYGYARGPLIQSALPQLSISPAAIHDERFSEWVNLRPGQLVDTNIGGGPDLLRITGARVAGHDVHYHLVLAVGPRTAAASARPRTPVAAEHLTIAPAQTAPVVLGRALSLLGAIALLGALAGPALRRRLRPQAISSRRATISEEKRV
jgi:hypothetical protein